MAQMTAPPIAQVSFQNVVDLRLRSQSSFLDFTPVADPIGNGNGNASPRISFGTGETFYLLSTDVMIPGVSSQPQGPVTSWYMAGPSGAYMGTASSVVDGTGFVKGAWIEFTYPKAVQYDGWGFNSFQGYDIFRPVSPESLVLLGSNTGQQWTLLDMRSAARSIDPSGTFRYQICAPMPFAKYRLVITRIASSDAAPGFLDTPLLMGGVCFYDKIAPRPCIIMEVPWSLLTEALYTILPGPHVDLGNILLGISGRANATPINQAGLLQCIQSKQSSIRTDASGGLSLTATYGGAAAFKTLKGLDVARQSVSEHVLRMFENILSVAAANNAAASPRLWSGSARVQALSALDTRISSMIHAILATPESQGKIARALVESYGAAPLMQAKVGDGSLAVDSIKSTMLFNMDLTNLGITFFAGGVERSVTVRTVPMQLKLGPY